MAEGFSYLSEVLNPKKELSINTATTKNNKPKSSNQVIKDFEKIKNVKDTNNIAKIVKEIYEDFYERKLFQQLEQLKNKLSAEQYKTYINSLYRETVEQQQQCNKALEKIGEFVKYRKMTASSELVLKNYLGKQDISNIPIVSLIDFKDREKTQQFGDKLDKLVYHIIDENKRLCDIFPNNMSETENLVDKNFFKDTNLGKYLLKINIYKLLVTSIITTGYINLTDMFKDNLIEIERKPQKNNQKGGSNNNNKNKTRKEVSKYVFFDEVLKNDISTINKIEDCQSNLDVLFELQNKDNKSEANIFSGADFDTFENTLIYYKIDKKTGNIIDASINFNGQPKFLPLKEFIGLIKIDAFNIVRYPEILYSVNKLFDELSPSNIIDDNDNFKIINDAIEQNTLFDFFLREHFKLDITSVVKKMGKEQIKTPKYKNIDLLKEFNKIKNDKLKVYLVSKLIYENDFFYKSHDTQFLKLKGFQNNLGKQVLFGYFKQNRKAPFFSEMNIRIPINMGIYTYRTLKVVNSIEKRLTTKYKDLIIPYKPRTNNNKSKNYKNNNQPKNTNQNKSSNGNNKPKLSNNRAEEMKQKLQKAQEIINKITRKIDETEDSNTKYELIDKKKRAIELKKQIKDKYLK